MIRLEEVPFELDGKTYKLRCNMNVLADAQDAFGGDFSQALDPEHSFRGLTVFLSAMLNDFAEDMGWPERFDARSLGRKLNKYQVPEADIMALVVASMTPPATQVQGVNGQPTENSGN